MLYSNNPDAYDGIAKIACANDTNTDYSTDFFINGFCEGWYYYNGIGFYPCTEPASHYYTLTIIDGSVTSGGNGSCCSIMQDSTVSITANDAPSDKIFDKWVIEATGITTAEGQNAVIPQNNITSTTTTVCIPHEDVKIRATYKTAPTITPNYTVSPATDSDSLESIREIILTFSDNELVHFEDGLPPIHIDDAIKGNETSVGITLTWGAEYNIIKLSADSEITATGTYAITIPGETLYADQKIITEPITLTYTIISRNDRLAADAVIKRN